VPAVLYIPLFVLRIRDDFQQKGLLFWEKSAIFMLYRDSAVGESIYSLKGAVFRQRPIFMFSCFSCMGTDRPV
jgi:hypothetical protein